jgi:hypothetical protein
MGCEDDGGRKCEGKQSNTCELTDLVQRWVVEANLITRVVGDAGVQGRTLRVKGSGVIVLVAKKTRAFKLSRSWATSSRECLAASS